MVRINASPCRGIEVPPLHITRAYIRARIGDNILGMVYTSERGPPSFIFRTGSRVLPARDLENLNLEPPGAPSVRIDTTLLTSATRQELSALEG